ncbi:hypothetical protein HDK77DRAFT_440165 [Phyllosticta capitalensis]
MHTASPVQQSSSFRPRCSSLLSSGFCLSTAMAEQCLTAVGMHWMTTMCINDKRKPVFLRMAAAVLFRLSAFSCTCRSSSSSRADANPQSPSPGAS